MRIDRINSQSIILVLKLLRHSYRRMVTSFRVGTLSGSPMLFANSFPKSGTHLLTQVLHGFTNIGPAVDSGFPAIVMYDGPTGKPLLMSLILNELHRLKAGDICYGHLHALPDLVAELTRKEVATFFIYRDPRDVVVSHVYYVTEIDEEHVHHPYYAKELKTFDERLQVSILGRSELEVPFPDIRRRFEPYLDWLETPGVLTLQYEDFITQRGPTLESVLDHAENRGFRLAVPRAEALRRLDSAIEPEKSPTFRSGTIGKWRESFSSEHKAVFKQVAGDLLVRLGYERDNNW
jgi:hypothetical protein